jgi:hypothetical protein
VLGETVPGKILVTNASALQQRYGAAGYQAIQQALARLIAADSARNVMTQIVELDNAQHMTACGGQPVPGPTAEPETKLAINAVLAAHNPDYLLILGGSDIVCHQRLTNPMPGDGDPDVPSDLPYANHTSQYATGIQAHIGATHVVGRLPEIPNAQNPLIAAPNPQPPTFIVGLIDRAAQAQSRPIALYQQGFSLSAAVWSTSTQMSASAIFGGGAVVQNAPPTGPPVAPSLLHYRSHFINCHGAPADYQFYGQQGTNYPPAMSSSDIVGKISDGCVATAECCYGAEIYDPALAGDMGLCCRYLSEGAYGFFGSTNIAYGPAASNANADLIAQYFLHEIAANGASIGRACLAARQRFVQAAGPILSNADLKTLGQFLLLGDPSLHPAVPPQPATAAAAAAVLGPQVEAQNQRTARRLDLAAKGAALPRSVLHPGQQPIPSPTPGSSTYQRLVAIAARLGITNPDLTSFDVVGDAAMLTNAKAFGQVPVIHILMSMQPAVGKLTAVRAVVIFQYDDRLVPRQDLFSR